MTPISLIAAAMAMPARVVDNSYFGLHSPSGMFKGSKERRHLTSNESAASLISEAVLNIKDQLALNLSTDVDLILTNVSCPDAIFTGCGISVSKVVKAKPRWILDIHNSGCVSFIYMLGLAHELMQAGQVKTALICCAQTAAGRIFSHEENRELAQSSIPGDGCGVAYVVANNSSPIKSIVHHSYNEYADDMQIKTDDNREYWEPHRKALHIDFNENKIATLVGRGNALVPAVINEACVACGITKNQIDFLITNQPNQIFLRNWREALEIQKERQIQTFEEYGNLFGAAIPIGIKYGLDKGQLTKGVQVALGGFSHAGDYAAAAIWQV